MRFRTPTELGLMIRERRKKLGLDQRSLAEKVGVSRQWIIAIEQGKRRAEIGLVLKTLEVLGLQMSIEAGEAARSLPSTKLPAIDIDAVVARARGRKP
jgi:HTH-type transcriptional regulator/antitoxin HipB